MELPYDTAIPLRVYTQHVCTLSPYVVSDSFATPWTVARQAPLSMGCFRQEYCSGLPFPSPGDLPDPGTEPKSPHWQKDSLPLSPLGSSIYPDKTVIQEDTCAPMFKAALFTIRNCTQYPVINHNRKECFENRMYFYVYVNHFYVQQKLTQHCKSAMHAQLCPMLSNPMECSPPGSSVHGILQARTLEWVLPRPSPGDLPHPGIKLGSWFSCTGRQILYQSTTWESVR